MIKIALYGDTAVLKIVEDILSSTFEKNNISFEIYTTSKSLVFMRSYLPNHDFKIYIVCRGEKTSYILRSYKKEQASDLIFGKISFPPTSDEINENLLRNHELSKVCPYREYILKSKNIQRKILHEDIEYIEAEGHKTIFHLKNGDTETTSQNMGLILYRLNAKYFVKCSRKYVVNIFNIHKIRKTDGVQDIIELMSGVEIPLTNKHSKEFFSAYSLPVPRLLDD